MSDIGLSDVSSMYMHYKIMLESGIIHGHQLYPSLESEHTPASSTVEAPCECR